MCQGFRDLFLHAALGFEKLKVRAVEAYNYYPQLNDLITYGHSTAEIWLEQNQKWVLFDPWYAIMLQNESGQYIGAFDVQTLDDTKNIKVAPILGELPRQILKPNNETRKNTFYPSSIKLSEFTCDKEGCTPGYQEYFKNIKIRNVTVYEKN